MTYYPPVVTQAVAAVVADCYLASPAGTNLVLQRYNGTQLTIAGTPQTIPSAGVTLAPAGFTPGLIYYVYAYWTGSAIALEASTTGFSFDAVTGMMTKTGDTTRMLAGKAYCDSGPNFRDRSDLIGVLSYYNRKPKVAYNLQLASYTTGSTSAIEVSTDLRAYFHAWNDDMLLTTFDGRLNHNVAGGWTNLYATIQGGGLEGNSMQQATVAGQTEFAAIMTYYSTVTFNLATLYWSSPYWFTSGATGAVVLSGSAAGSRGCNRVTVMG